MSEPTCSLEDLLVAASSVIDLIGTHLAAKHPSAPGRNEVWPHEDQILVTSMNLLHEMADRLIEGNNR